MEDEIDIKEELFFEDSNREIKIKEELEEESWKESTIKIESPIDIIKGEILTSNSTHCEEMFECVICWERFVTSRALLSHLCSHNKDNECEFCERKFPTPSKLKRHMMTHTGEKPFECQVCKKRFTTNKLKSHMMIHTGEKPFECQVCKKRFRTNRLKLHMITHTGEKPFECQVCKRKFPQKYGLTRHIITHHNYLKCHTHGPNYLLNKLQVANEIRWPKRENNE